MTDDTIIVQASDQVADRQTYKHSISAVWHAGGRAKQDFKWDARKRKIFAFDRSKNKQRWLHESACVPMTLCAIGDAIVYFDGRHVVSLVSATGKPKWKSEPLVSEEYARVYELGTAFAPTLVLYRDTVLFAGKEKKQNNVLTGVDLATGKVLWNTAYHHAGHHSPEDVIPMNGLVWTGATARVRKDGGKYSGLDPRTGEVRKEFMPDVNPNYWFHQRCYRAKATKKFILASATGIEYIDPVKGTWDLNHWVRGGCLYGIMPANGMTYVPPNPCACYSETQIRALSAFASATGTLQIQEANRLVKGPAFARPLSAEVRPEDWPVYRQNNQRTSAVASSVPAQPIAKWQLAFNGDITPPVAAGGTVFVAVKNRHAVHAVDQRTGKRRWQFTAGGRIDSSPALWKGRVYFGCTNGWVYCLDASDGALVWRFRAAPSNRQMLAHEQLESVWPVHGSVLIEHDRLYALAGRSIFVDGGLYMSVLDPLTGELINSEVFDDIDPINSKSMQIRQQSAKLPASRTDILSSDGNKIFLMSQAIDKDGKRMWPGDKNQTPGEKGLTLNREDQVDDNHLISLSGFLDDSWFHRTYWLYGKATGGGWGGWMTPMKLVPSGRIMSIGKDNIYGYGRKPVFFRQSSVTEYQLYSVKQGQFSKEKAAALRRPPKVVMGPEQQQKYDQLKNAANDARREHGKESLEYEGAHNKYVDYRKYINQLDVNRKLKEVWREDNPDVADWKQSARFPDSKHTILRYNWQQKDPKIMVRGMVLAGDTLLAAGPPDLVNEEGLYGLFTAKDTQPKLQKQQAAWNGELGGSLWLIDTASGDRKATVMLAAPPVFDGMIVANGQVLISQMNKTLVCFDSDEKE